MCYKLGLNIPKNPWLEEFLLQAVWEHLNLTQTNLKSGLLWLNH